MSATGEFKASETKKIELEPIWPGVKNCVVLDNFAYLTKLE